MPAAVPSILLVIKDAHLRNIFLNRFLREGWKAVGAESIDEGERKAVKLRPSLFLVEVEDVTEIKTLSRHWKSLPTLQKSKIVVLLPKAERSHVDEALTNGADQVILSGTLLPQEIVASLTRLIS